MNSVQCSRLYLKFKRPVDQLMQHLQYNYCNAAALIKLCIALEEIATYIYICTYRVMNRDGTQNNL